MHTGPAIASRPLHSRICGLPFVAADGNDLTRVEELSLIVARTLGRFDADAGLEERSRRTPATRIAVALAAGGRLNVVHRRAGLDALWNAFDVIHSRRARHRWMVKRQNDVNKPIFLASKLKRKTIIALYESSIYVCLVRRIFAFQNLLPVCVCIKYISFNNNNPVLVAVIAQW